mmetsp:Transcript_62657/g.110602  ORF Transcript_62657/g.110602 Transcript_62657/m.110602 type:complete len:646 (-) Transcript_62657:277-2214(-)
MTSCLDTQRAGDMVLTSGLFGDLAAFLLLGLLRLVLRVGEHRAAAGRAHLGEGSLVDEDAVLLELLLHAKNLHLLLCLASLLGIALVLLLHQASGLLLFSVRRLLVLAALLLLLALRLHALHLLLATLDLRLAVQGAQVFLLRGIGDLAHEFLARRSFLGLQGLLAQQQGDTLRNLVQLSTQLRHLGVHGKRGGGSRRTEVNGAGTVVHAELQLLGSHALNQDALNGGGLQVAQTSEELVHEVQLDSAVHAAQLLHELHDRHALQRSSVHIQSGVGLDNRHGGGDLLHQVQGLELHLQVIVESGQLGQGVSQVALGHDLAEEGLAGGVGLEIQEQGHLRALLHHFLLLVTERVDIAGGRHRERGEKHTGGQHALLLGLEVLLGLHAQVVVSEPRVRVQQLVVTHPEDALQLVVVCHHQLGLGGLLAGHHDGVNVLHSAETFVPQLQSGGAFQLSKAGLQVELHRLGGPLPLGADSRSGSGGLLQVGQLHAKGIAESLELQHTVVLQTELERLLAERVVSLLQLGDLVQKLQNGAVTLPKELEPRNNDFSVGAVLRDFLGHGREHNTLGSLLLIKVRHAGSSHDCHLVGFQASSSSTSLSELHQVVDNYFQRTGVNGLAEVSVLVKSIFSSQMILKINAKLQVTLH